MTKQEINKAFRGALLIFNRAGVDEIITIESPKEKKSIKDWMIFDLELNEPTYRLTRIGHILYIDEKSWIENNG
jgi:hypothetical protein